MQPFHSHLQGKPGSLTCNQEFMKYCTLDQKLNSCCVTIFSEHFDQFCDKFQNVLRKWFQRGSFSGGMGVEGSIFLIKEPFFLLCYQLGSICFSGTSYLFRFSLISTKIIDELLMRF